MPRINNEKSIVHEGWLTKSPPSKRVWRYCKWRRRWFSLRESSEKPNHYFLDYYTDSVTRKLKGSIDLDLCDQLDAGLRMQHSFNEESTVFSIRTRNRVYHLEADHVIDMEKWVDVICKACGMRSTEDKSYSRKTENNAVQFTPTTSGPYIPISECFTGPPQNIHQDPNLAEPSFSLHTDRSKSEGDACSTFPDSSVMTSKSISVTDNVLYTNRDAMNRQIENAARLNDHEPVFEEDESKDDHMRRHQAATLNMIKHFDNVAVSDRKIVSGAAVPPRPPKPSHLVRELPHKESYAGPRINEPTDPDFKFHMPSNSQSVRSMQTYANTADTRGQHFRSKSRDFNPATNEYRNIPYGPEVNRNLKPGRSKSRHGMDYPRREDSTVFKLQYVDLDSSYLESSASSVRSRSAAGSPTIYKTVDFQKTEALNMTRIDTEAYRRKDIPLHD